MKNKRTSLQDIADIVGVTKMTVSRYLRSPEQVAQRTRAKIEQAIDKTGYIPNRAPALLSNSKSLAIGVLVPSLTNQVFADVIKGIEEVTEAAGYQVMLAHYGYCEQIEEQRITSLLSYQVDGLILSDFKHTDRTLSMIQMAGVPTVEMMDTTQKAIHQAVGFNNVSAGYLMTQRLIDKGYRQCLYLGARLDARTHLKKQGYAQAMRENGLTPNYLLTEKPSSFSLGRAMLLDALDKHPNVDSFFCTNDDLATGLIFECHKQGIKVPQQLGIAGFHGLDVGQSLVPRLASVMTPRQEIGRIAAQQILMQISGKNTQCNTIELPVNIEDGESI
ncbi:substrate-binding domain-containing protein [Vibrio sp. S4M6]|uniref:substrate-binding domain-containing protein n=1 Tax=Vibrio sinus TaxID=2946865 RepID=UPI002029D931|nr:substrate-binding domain-containing protein [Vibrio sinus]